jgi:sirohydrochlorin cobaltochelatase
LPDLVPELVRSGIERITVVPVFLGQGGHVLRDLPVMIDQLRADHPQLAVRVVEAAGENAAVLQAIADYCIGSLAGAG